MNEDLPALNGTMSDTRWLSALEDFADAIGEYVELDARHHAAFLDRGPVLLVTFETTASIRKRPDGKPQGIAIAAQRNWSSLTLIATRPTWWRCEPVYLYFDALIDGGFFDNFDRVVFCGAGMGGYAAGAYSVAAPGATVLLIAPQATLDPAIAGWDDRFRDFRRLEFSDRYGYAPDMVEAAASCHVLFDPYHHLDAMHAALFRGPATHLLPTRHFGTQTADLVEEMGIVEAALLAAGDGALDTTFLHEVLRLRRDHEGWLRNLLRATVQGNSPLRTEVLCRSVLKRMESSHFKKALKQVAGDR